MKPILFLLFITAIGCRKPSDPVLQTSVTPAGSPAAIHQVSGTISYRDSLHLAITDSIKNIGGWYTWSVFYHRNSGILYPGTDTSYALRDTGFYVQLINDSTAVALNLELALMDHATKDSIYFFDRQMYYHGPHAWLAYNRKSKGLVLTVPASAANLDYYIYTTR
ncbi:MAG: hypothetical protein V4649_00555 [Bacteroidota bacterium]